MQNSRRILHISHTDIRCDSRILKELAAHQSVKAYDVVAIGVRNEIETPVSTVDDSIQIETLDLLCKKLAFMPRAVRYTLMLLELLLRVTVRAFKIRPKVVHCHDTLILPVGWLLKCFTGCQLVYDAHELESDKAAQSKVLSWGTLLLEKLCWPKIDLFISVSPSIINWYNQKFSPKPSALVLNAPDLSKMKNVATVKNKYLHQKFNIPESAKIYLYLGALVDGRGVEVSLDAFANESIQSHLVFMGYGSLQDYILAYADKHPNIHFHPAVNHQEVVTVSQSADVGLCLLEVASLSDYYCLPNKLFEYSFAKLPILAANFPDIKTYIERHDLGQVTEVDVESIINTVKEFEQSDREYQFKDLEQISWSAQSDRLLKSYQQMLIKEAE